MTKSTENSTEVTTDAVEESKNFFNKTLAEVLSMATSNTVTFTIWSFLVFIIARIV